MAPMNLMNGVILHPPGRSSKYGQHTHPEMNMTLTRATQNSPFVEVLRGNGASTLQFGTVREPEKKDANQVGG